MLSEKEAPNKAQIPPSFAPSLYQSSTEYTESKSISHISIALGGPKTKFYLMIK